MMKLQLRRAMGFAALTLGVGLAFGPALADEPVRAKTNSVCLDSYRIDHTEILNNHQIVFHMRGKEKWVNNLPAPCVTLTSQEGFIWESWYGKYCDNAETIRVIRSGQVCMLGAFTPYEKPKAS